MATLSYVVPEIHCGHCQAAIEREVGAVEGVTGVRVDLDAKRVEVEGEATDADVRAAIAEAGYDDIRAG